MAPSLRFQAVLILVATLAWTGIVAVSDKVTAPKVGTAAQRASMAAPSTPTQLSAEQKAGLEKLQNEVEAAEVGSEAQRAKKLELGRALMDAAEISRDPKQIMSAIQNFSEVLEGDPKNLEALQLLGDISFGSGVVDKAASYYRRYLEVRPEDVRVQTDLALTFLQSGENDEAVKLLEEVIKKEPHAFPPRLSLALAYKLSGRSGEAKIAAEKALQFAPDDQGREVVNNFLAELGGADKGGANAPSSPSQTPAAPTPSSATGSSTASLSPAQTIDSFFRNHSIVGPKLTAIRWRSESEVEVVVKEFPVEAMPPFAREKFLSNIKATVQSLPQPVTVVLRDAASNQELLKVAPEGK